MSIKSKIEKLEQRKVEPPLTLAEFERAEANRANAYHILSTMAMEDREYICRKILDYAHEPETSAPARPFNPLVTAFYKLQALMLSEQLRQVEPRVYAIPPAIAEQYLKHEEGERFLPVTCDCARCGLIHPRWTQHYSEMPPCVLCGGHVGLNAWHLAGRGHKMISKLEH
jgi:hypothetical protein